MVGERLHDFNRFKRAYSINAEESEDIIDHKKKKSERIVKKSEEPKNEDLLEVLKKEPSKDVQSQ